MSKMYYFLLIWIFLHFCSAIIIIDTHHSAKCERITIPMCLDMPYNLTRMPNLMGHTDQSEAAIKVHEFVPLVEVKCSKHLKFFLCSLYAPMCTEQVDVAIPSCQSICEKVKTGCLPFLKRFNFDWPPSLNCSRLPVPENGLCMESPDVAKDRKEKNKHGSESHGSKDAKSVDIATPRVPLLPESPYYYPGRGDMQSLFNGKIPPPLSDKSRVFLNELETTDATIPPPNKCPSKYVHVGGKTNRLGIECAAQCGKDVMFTQQHKHFSSIWMTLCAIVCFISTLVTMLTFCIDTTRFRYPERPIIFLSMCYNVYSMGYLIRIFSGFASISCDLNNDDEAYLIIEGLQSTGCIVVFLVLYYFGVASSIWWVNLTIAWYLAAGKKWGHEAIESLATYFHVAAWGIPAIKTIIALTLRRIDGEELTGLCFVGNQDSFSLLMFVILPSCVYFFVGELFLVMGFVAMCRIRHVMKERRALTTGRGGVIKFEKLMFRIGFFSFSYSVPAICVIGCQIYEYHFKNIWLEEAASRAAVCDIEQNVCTLKQSIPQAEIFFFKIFMSLLLGSTTGIWILSTKTWQSWHLFCCRTLFCNKNHISNKRNVSSHVVKTYKPTIQSSVV